jgi:hypothetical protein
MVEACSLAPMLSSGPELAITRSSCAVLFAKTGRSGNERHALC